MTACGDHIRDLIGSSGPISVERYMEIALGHPTLGYYMTRDPFGASGDFITAPEVSQIFGELLGLWCVDYWARMGAPGRVQLVELGPGRGTLMRDALRAARVVPAFLAAVEVALVETSPTLRAAQKTALAGVAPPVAWFGGVEDIPGGPMIALANEFFDALPARQYVKTTEGWRERVIGLDGRGELGFGAAPRVHESIEESIEANAPDGAILERNLVAERVMFTLAKRVAKRGGAVLAIDYGHVKSGVGDTLQAMRRHEFVDALAEPGEADLTTHVDFEALARAAARAGASTRGPVTQGLFLNRLGAGERARKLAAGADAAAARRIMSELTRLTAGGRLDKVGMGGLFKALAVTQDGGPEPIGFSENLASP